MLPKICGRLITGVVATLALCLPAVADIIVDDLEDGNNKNVFERYWYTYQYGYTTDISLTPSGDFTPTAGGANSSGFAAAITFSGLGSAGTNAEIGMGTPLTASETAGYGNDFNDVDSISFWAKGPAGLKFYFYVHTEENAPNGNTNKYGKQLTIVYADTWTRYSVSLKPVVAPANAGQDVGAAPSGKAGDLTQAPYYGKAYAFAPEKATRLSWAIKKADNTTGTTANPTTSPASGTFAVDDITLIGAITIPPPPPVTKYALTYRVSTESGGWVSVNDSRDTARVDSVVAGASGPIVTAIPLSGEYRFVTWSDGNTNAMRTDVATENKVFSATFTRKYTTTYVAGSGGLLSVNGASAMVQDHVVTLSPDSATTVLAVPDPGFKFVKWDDDKTDPERTDGYMDKSSTFTAIFAVIPTDPGSGAVSLTYTAGSGGKIRAGSDGDLELAVVRYVEPGQPGPTVKAVPDAGYLFVEWSDGSKDTARTDTPTASVTLSAVFTPITFVATYTAGNGGLLQTGDVAEYVPTCTFRVAAGRNAAPVTAIADQGYKFVGWSDGVEDAVRIDLINADLEVAAIFQPRAIAVASPNREIPTAPPAEITAVTPVVIIAGELTAGPNPTTAAVKFFRTGRSIKTGKLSVYDASGNVVTTLKLNDKGNNGKRVVGKWNLTDTRGRQVANGSYAVKGTVTTKDGAKENVSTIITVVK